jgi:histidine ammonia-lyase
MVPPAPVLEEFSMVFVIDSRHDITLEAARRVGWHAESVSLTDRSVTAMAAARARFMDILENDPEVTIYGVTTGMGQLAKRKLTPDERKAQAKFRPTGAAASWGDPLPERVVRLIVLARLANFVDGHAAISPHVAQAAAAMLDGGPLPQVPARGQGGAGEIVALSHLFAGLVDTAEPAEKDMLSLINGSPCASALVADAALAAMNRLRLAAEVFALSAEGFNAPLGHFARPLEDLWNNPHDAWALRTVRELLDGGHGGARRPYQAPVSFRIMPRMLGQAHRAAAMAQEVAAQSLAAATDNPVLLDPDDNHPFGEFVSTGGYHNAQAAMAMDMLSAAYANLCVIGERHSAKLLDGAISLLPDQLLDDGDGEGEGARRGYMGCLPMAATGYEEEARLYAQPTLLPGSESGGFGQNDVASPVFLAWTKQARAGHCLDLVLATLAPIALRALDVTSRPVPAPLTPLAAEIESVFQDLAARQPLGPSASVLAERFEARVFERE